MQFLAGRPLRHLDSCLTVVSSLGRWCFPQITADLVFHEQLRVMLALRSSVFLLPLAVFIALSFAGRARFHWLHFPPQVALSSTIRTFLTRVVFCLSRSARLVLGRTRLLLLPNLIFADSCSRVAPSTCSFAHRVFLGNITTGHSFYSCYEMSLPNSCQVSRSFLILHCPGSTRQQLDRAISVAMCWLTGDCDQEQDGIVLYDGKTLRKAVERQ